jgi:signal transduction histidine kinase/DNA-binding NarL/FixJ family response regulator
MFRDLIGALLQAEDLLEVVAIANSAREGIAACELHRPDILLLDLALPDGCGLTVARALAKCHPASRTIVVSGQADTLLCPPDLKSHIYSIVDKTRAFAALRTEINNLVREPARVGIPPGDAEDVLTPSELVVYRLVGRGLSSKEIAARIHNSAHTVDTHRRKICAKLGLGASSLVQHAAIHNLLSQSHRCGAVARHPCSGSEIPDSVKNHPALQLTENFPVGAYVFYRDPVDNGPRFSFLSNRLLEMLDITREEAEANPLNVYRTIHPDDIGPFIEVSLEAARQKALFANESRYIVRGETKWYRLESFPCQLDDGLTVWDGAVIDVTERRAAEERERENGATQRLALERKLRASLAASAAAHEINQPLGRILLTTQLVLEHEAAAAGADSKLSGFVRELATEAQSVVSTIEKMKALIRNVETAREPIDLRDIMGSALLYAGSFAREAGVEISHRQPAKPVRLLGDANQLQVALNNLLRNAIEAIAGADSPKREISIELASREGSAELVIGDSGPGWPGGTLDEMLLQTKKPSGSGIGLYVAKTAMENHHGRIEIGRSPLGGAEFRMVFPMGSAL